MKILTFKETSVIIDRFKLAKEMKDEILSSKKIYENLFDVGFGDCLVKIFEFENRLYMSTEIDEVFTLEPLLIQVEDDGTIMDFILLDFVIRFRNCFNLESYYVLPSDYSFIMDRVR